ncbi:sulfotransferase family protein [Bailinhaonella thermotolerans]|uniref:sulfotransferase family protein n=1 Tax=Bailinhaonella thermotolerans TaxID=1070861 RepID=UPI001F5B940A|nr:sulfotransferase [Bailinhaonella thermotolerans]
MSTGTLKRAAHGVSRTTGRITYRTRVLPGFLIVGAQRCGTTSLYRALSSHPAILKPVLHKGVHFFDVAYHRGLPWYQAHFPLALSARRAGRAHGVCPIAFESSPYYLFHPLAPERIARDLPGVKLIALVRDPVERAYSAHAHELARGFETEPFERAIELEEDRLRGEVARMHEDPRYVSHAHRHHAYRGRGRYAEQLDRLAALVGRDRIHVIDSGDLFADPEPVYDRVLEFLGLPRLHDPVFERHNARPRTAPMPAALRRSLESYFAPHDHHLIRWLGDTPSWHR